MSFHAWLAGKIAFLKRVQLHWAARRIQSLAYRVTLLSLTVVLLSPVLIFSAELSEYMVKAGFVIKLVNFVDWPEKVHSRSSKIIVCTMGSDSFSSAVSSLAKKNGSGKNIEMYRVEDIEEIEGCHVLFIGESQRKNISRIVKYIDNAPVLTVSEVVEFIDFGGMVNLLIERKNLFFEVNNAAVNRAGLRISPQVLMLARKVVKQ